MKKSIELEKYLNQQFHFYHNKDFIKLDPISVPHRFSKLQDIEISAFFAAIFSWGNRKTIINKSLELMHMMDESPHEFIVSHSPSHLKKLLGFKHRTFNADDLLYFIHFLKYHYSSNNSLESAFTKNMKTSDQNIENALIGFRDYFFSLPDYLERTKKHISSPLSKSTCKRLCMMLRWMVRDNSNSVDFGIWNKIKPHQLIIPLDVHVMKTALKLKLLPNDKVNWNAAVLLTDKLSIFDSKDPVKYDFALFGSSIQPNE